MVEGLGGSLFTAAKAIACLVPFSICQHGAPYRFRLYNVSHTGFVLFTHRQPQPSFPPVRPRTPPGNPWFNATVEGGTASSQQLPSTPPSNSPLPAWSIALLTVGSLLIVALAAFGALVIIRRWCTAHGGVTGDAKLAGHPSDGGCVASPPSVTTLSASTRRTYESSAYWFMPKKQPVLPVTGVTVGVTGSATEGARRKGSSSSARSGGTAVGGVRGASVSGGSGDLEVFVAQQGHRGSRESCQEPLKEVRGLLNNIVALICPCFQTGVDFSHLFRCLGRIPWAFP